MPSQNKPIKMIFYHIPSASLPHDSAPKIAGIEITRIKSADTFIFVHFALIGKKNLGVSGEFFVMLRGVFF